MSCNQKFRTSDLPSRLQLSIDTTIVSEHPKVGVAEKSGPTLSLKPHSGFLSHPVPTGRAPSCALHYMASACHRSVLSCARCRKRKIKVGICLLKFPSRLADQTSVTVRFPNAPSVTVHVLNVMGTISSIRLKSQGALCNILNMRLPG